MATHEVAPLDEDVEAHIAGVIAGHAAAFGA